MMDTIFTKKIRSDFYGKLGLESYKDESVSIETEIKALKKLGFKDNEHFKFSHKVIKEIENNQLKNILPASIHTYYSPKYIKWLKGKSLEITLSTSYSYSGFNQTLEVANFSNKLHRVQLKLPPKRDRIYRPNSTWNSFKLKIDKIAEELEFKLLQFNFFFEDDNFKDFSYDKVKKKWVHKQEKGYWTFHRINVGNPSDNWGMLWLPV